MRFDAFMSYSHAADGKLAPALQSSLHRFAKPWYRLRAVRIFRDQTTLTATPELWGSIQSALKASDHFVLLASPEAAASAWVQKEIGYWVEHKSSDRMLIVLTDGEIVWDETSNDFAWPRTTALPDDMAGVFAGEPLYVDLRHAKATHDLSPSNPDYLDVIADLSAVIRGHPKDEMIGEDVRQHRITRRWQWGIGIVLVLLTAAALVGAYVASVQRDEARKQRDDALARGLAAQAELMIDQQGILLDTAALLAVEAMRRSPSADVDRAIRKALFLLPSRVAEVDLGAASGVRAISPDGTHLAIAGQDGVVRVVECLTGRLRSDVSAGDVSKLVFHPSSPHLAILGQDGFTVLDFESGGVLEEAVHAGMSDLAFGAAGVFLASVGSDRRTRLWSADDYTEFAWYENAEPMAHVALAPRAIELIAWNAGIAEIFRSPGAPLSTRRRAPQAGGEGAFEYSADGKFLAEVVQGAFLASLFDVDTQEHVIFEDRRWDVAFSGDGQVYALASPEWDAHAYFLPTCFEAGLDLRPTDKGVVVPTPIWGRVSCQHGNSVHHDDSMNTVSLSHHGAYLGTTSRDGTARVWEPQRGREVLRLLEETEGEIRQLVFHRDERHVTGLGPTTCRTWGSTGHRQVAALEHDDAVHDIAFSRDGRRVATISQDGTARIWSVPDGAEVARTEIDGRWGKTHSIDLSPDGTSLLVNGRKIWKAGATDPEPHTVVGAEGDQTVIDENWRFVATRRAHDMVVIRQFETKQELARLQETIRGDITMSADGSAVAAITAEAGVTVWRWETGELATGLASGSSVREVVLSRDGGRLATLEETDDGLVEVWDVLGHRRLARLPQERRVNSIAFDPPGEHVVTTSSDWTARIWRIADGTLVAQFEHDYEVEEASFSNDARFVLSAGGRSDRTARLWLWRPEDLIEAVCARVGRSLTREEWDVYIGTDDFRPTCPCENEGNHDG